jgi:hypothetical protein
MGLIDKRLIGNGLPTPVRGYCAMDGTNQSSPRLLDQIRDRLRTMHYSLRTETSYVDWIRRFILFHGKRHPRDMGGPEIAAFLTGLD